VVDRHHPSLSIVRQCRLMDISRSGLYYQPKGISEEDLTLMKLIDRQYLAMPFYGARKITACLKSQGQRVNRKRIRRLMRVMGLKAIYRRPRTSKPAPGHKIYPYLLSGLKVTRPNQVWAADITYIPMAPLSCPSIPTLCHQYFYPSFRLHRTLLTETYCRLLMLFLSVTQSDAA